MAPPIGLEDLAMGLSFLRGLGSYFRRPVQLEEARKIIRSRFSNRESDFLRLARASIYQNPANPYFRLLKIAGCEYGDLAGLIQREGLEGALYILFRNGVYLSVNEYKGRRPVVRGKHVLEVNPGLLRNPRSASHFKGISSGSSAASVQVPISADYMKDCSADHLVALAARNGLNWRHSIWGVPGTTDITRALDLSGLGSPPEHWFSQVAPDAPGLHPRYRWSARLLHWVSKIAGKNIPLPEHVPLDDPLPIVRWMRGVLDEGQVPHLVTWVSPAMRVSQAALRAGIDISGTQLSLGGEPCTEARLKTLRKSGVMVVPRYLTTECQYVGYGCLKPRAPDELHFIHDLHAIIQPGELKGAADSGLPSKALLITSLRPTAPLFLLNTSLGDQADFIGGSCGCAMEAMGWVLRMRAVRSFEKLTSGGMTFLDLDVIRILEEVLPSRFGGTPIDYQLAEDEDEEGNPRLRLFVHPAVGPIDDKALEKAFLDSVAKGSGAERVMGLQWKSGAFLAVERRAPETTSSGKILHVLRSRR